MKPINDIRNELKELGVDIPHGINTPYSLKHGYFSDFETHILEHIKTLDFLGTLPKTNPFSVDPDYFQTLPESIGNQIFIDKLPKNNPYLVPEGYFENNISGIRKIAKPSLVPLRSGYKSLKYSLSMAAAVLAFLSLSFYLINRPTHVNLEQGLASMSSSEITSYLDSHAVEFDLALDTETLDYNEIDLNNLKKNFIEKQLQELSDHEINDFIL